MIKEKILYALLLVSLVFIPYIKCDANAKLFKASQPIKTGVIFTPRNFPHHSGSDIREMFHLGQQLGEHSVFFFQWSDENCIPAADVLVKLSRQAQMNPIILLSITKNSGEKIFLDFPKTLKIKNASFSQAVVQKFYLDTVEALAQLKPSHLGLATNANLLANFNLKEYFHFVDVYKKAYNLIKKISPNTKVYVTFNWDIMYRAMKKSPHALKNQEKLIQAFGSNLDILYLSCAPKGPTAKNLRNLPKDYFSNISKLNFGVKDIYFQGGWPSAPDQEDQTDFINALPNLLKPIVNLRAFIWPMLHDLSISHKKENFFTLGLISGKGEKKPAFLNFANLAPKRQQTILPNSNASGSDDWTFAVFSARLDGSDLTLIASSIDRELTHPRISSDEQWITFTRYNNFSGHKFATEDWGGYNNTEILLVHANGDSLRSLTSHKKNHVAANSYWTPNGKQLLYVKRSPGSSARIYILDPFVNRTILLPTPEGLWVSDPHQVKKQLVFPVKQAKSDLSVLWTMNSSGENAHQLTFPKFSDAQKKAVKIPLGDYDPKLSPDGSRVAFMRHAGKLKWQIIVIDMKTGKESMLSASIALDAMPEWSSDGKLLVFWARDLKSNNFQSAGIFTMKPDGTDRKQIPLPNTYLYKDPSFYPGKKTSGKTKILFSVQKKNI